MLQLFCVPVAREDADSETHRLRAKAREREPVQGWAAWAEDIRDMIGVCESMDALERVRTRQASLLEALRSERAELYASLGQAFSCRSQELAQRLNEPRKAPRPKGDSRPAQKPDPVNTAGSATAERPPLELEKVGE